MTIVHVVILKFTPSTPYAIIKRVSYIVRLQTLLLT